MEFRGTPGPWKWDCGVIPPDGPGRYADIYIDGGEKIIARFNEFLEVAPEEGCANARLIAAAPELLEALAEMVELFHGYQGMELNRARAALARALGEE